MLVILSERGPRRTLQPGGGESKDLLFLFLFRFALCIRAQLVGQGFNPDNQPIHPFLEINPRDEVAIKFYPASLQDSGMMRRSSVSQPLVPLLLKYFSTSVRIYSGTRFD